MGQRSVKHSTVTSVTATFAGGVNYADPSTALADGELQEAVNVWYASGANAPTVRPGLQFIAEPPTGAGELIRTYSYVKGTLGSWLIGAFSNGQVYYLDDDTWVEILTLSSAVVTPAFLTFHDKLLIGDSGGEIKTWDGTTVATLTGSPHASILVSIGGRVVATSSSDLDALIYSGPEDETDWDITSGSALMERIGYGDGFAITAVEAFGSDLVVFKSGASASKIMRVVNAALSADSHSVAHVAWSAAVLSPQAVVSAANNILFGTDHGIFDLAGVQQYGDIQISVAGRKINPALAGRQVVAMEFLPTFGVVFAFVSGDYRVFGFHPHLSAWTTLDFAQIRFLSACVHSGNVYVGSSAGRLYRLTSGNSSDEITAGNFTTYTSKVRSKQYTADGDILIRRSRIYCEHLSGSTVELSAVESDGLTTHILLSQTGGDDAGMLYEADAKLNVASEMLGAAAANFQNGRARFRDQSCSFDIKVLSGRAVIRQLDIQAAQLNG